MNQEPSSEISERSFQPIRDQDLERLAEIGWRDFTDMTERLFHYAHLRQNVLCLALCQGGALHYLNGSNGVKDLDVWIFCRKVQGEADFHYRRLRFYDFGDPYFGRHPSWPSFVGRRVDVLGRSIEALPEQDPADTVRAYLHQWITPSAGYLAEKAVVMLWPDDRRGEIIWPHDSGAEHS